MIKHISRGLSALAITSCVMILQCGCGYTQLVKSGHSDIAHSQTALPDLAITSISTSVEHTLMMDGPDEWTTHCKIHIANVGDGSYHGALVIGWNEDLSEFPSTIVNLGSLTESCTLAPNDSVVVSSDLPWIATQPDTRVKVVLITTAVLPAFAPGKYYYVREPSSHVTESRYDNNEFEIVLQRDSTTMR